MSKKIECNVNGRDYKLEVDEKESLLEMLREQLELTGTKQGCGVGECGACAVMVDGVTVDSCIYLAVWADKRKIITIEGIANEDGTLSDIQQSFVESGAVQCGFCTPGMIMAGVEYLKNGGKADRKAIKYAISGHLCRCTGYIKIVDAIYKVAEEIEEGALA